MATDAPAAPEQTPEDALKKRNEELEAAQAQKKAAAEREERLKAEIAAIGQDRAKLNQQLIDIAAQVRSVENRIGETETNLQGLDGKEREMRGALVARRSEIGEVLAALQRAGRHVPPALFVRPEDSLQSLRSAMLLSSLVPDMRRRAEKIVADITELANVRKTIEGERKRLGSDRETLDRDSQKLAALIAERQKQQAEVEQNMAAERQRALTLSRQVENLQDLIAKLERDLESAAKAAAAAAAAAAAPPARPNLGALKDPGRLSPAVAFNNARGMLTLPVNGTKLRGYGGPDGAGGISRGISLGTKAAAQVTTPCDCWVVYAGPFRSYGQLLILNAGGGYHILLAGMERISVGIGQFVLTGEPVAAMGSGLRIASALAGAPGAGPVANQGSAVRSSPPVLYIEFRKDGTPIDPGPWWAASEGEKVRG
ncbi:MAG TPA: peptidoglycan DD-metalloendopeptidase family protein [Xanthobacteraceae bacterium]|nr:peptidoglycan DD-metalloendopeptidase family protein [Xanthobacteraceae bacterium]HWW49342.1 peptidoglycan DD-metalloendopeptidase family protein [Xanthobacteraceae bacterium]